MAIGSGLPNLNDIQFISFQGGGGKGVAYLGAIGCMQDNGGPLPLYDDNGKPRSAAGKLQGICGSSAGAITALLMYLGYGPNALKETFKSSGLLDQLVDPPEPGTVRWISKSPPPTGSGSAQGANEWTFSNWMEALAAAPGGDEIEANMGMGPGPFGTAISPFLEYFFNIGNDSLLGRLIADSRYFVCSLFDGGMLSGKRLRQWLGQEILRSPLVTAYTSSVAPNASPGVSLPQDGTAVTFAQLASIARSLGWNMDLAVTGTNITTGRPVVFTRTTTPDFPVSDAVASSASLPPVFKPAWVGADAPVDNQGKIQIPASSLAGWYVDGGVTNNVPIHLFDSLPMSFDPFDPSSQGPSASVSPQAGTKGLNTKMLALRLAPGDINPKPSDPQFPQWLGTTLSQVFDALSFGSNQGQIRSKSESDQTVTIYSDGAGLLDFVSTPTVVDSAYASGYNSFAQHYPSITASGQSS